MPHVFEAAASGRSKCRGCGHLEYHVAEFGFNCDIALRRVGKNEKYVAISILDRQRARDTANFNRSKSVHDVLRSGQTLDCHPPVPIIDLQCRPFRQLQFYPVGMSGITVVSEAVKVSSWHKYPRHPSEGRDPC